MAAWFKFFPNDWLSSPIVQTMTPIEEVTFFRLLLFDWSGEGIEPDFERLAMLTRTDAKTVEAVVQRAFNEHPDDRSKITNLRLHGLREEMKQQNAQRKQAAKKSVESRRRARANKGTEADQRAFNERLTSKQKPAQHELNDLKTSEIREQNEKEKINKKKRATQFPKDWKPQKEPAINAGLDYESAVEFFRNWAEGGGKTYVNWNAVWSNACSSWLADRLLGENRKQLVGTSEDRHEQGW